MSETAVATPDPNAISTHESSDGRTLSGMGVTSEALADVMERHEPEPVAEAPAAPTEPAKPATRGQARFAELTKARKDAEARAEAAEKRAAEYEAKSAQAPAAPTPTVAPAATVPTSPSPSGPERGDSGRPSGLPNRSRPSQDMIGVPGGYKDLDEYVLDSARWVTEQAGYVPRADVEAIIRQGIEADRASRDFNATVESTRAKGRKVYADFDAMVKSGPGSQVMMGRSPQDAEEKLHAIINHPATEHLQYAIMKDGGLAQRLAQANSIEFGMLLSTLAPANGAASLASTPSAGTITPPAPIQPVGSGSPTTPTPSASLIKGYDFDKSGYREKRAQERKARR